MLKKLLIRLLRWLTRSERRDYIRESRIKIMFNPLEGDGVYRWTRLDPKTHIWHWKRKPTLSEMVAWNSQPEHVRINGLYDNPNINLDDTLPSD